MNIKKTANLLLNFTIRRLAEIFGVLISLTGGMLFLALITYSPNDPNFIFPENTKIENLAKNENSYIVKTDKGSISSSSIVIATGGLSIPKIGASDFGYKIAEKFNLKVTNLEPALVPLIFERDILDFCKSLAGVSLNASVSINKITFEEGLIFVLI